MAVIKHFDPARDKCGHGQTFDERCIECEIVNLRALVRRSQENIERWTLTIMALQREQFDAAPVGRER